MCSDVDSTKTELDDICERNILYLFDSKFWDIGDMKSLKSEFIEVTRVVGDV